MIGRVEEAHSSRVGIARTHAIVAQFARIVSRIIGSNHLDSTRQIAAQRGGSVGQRQKIEVLTYSRPDAPS